MRLWLMGTIACGVISLGTIASRSVLAQSPGTFKNLQVLPKGESSKALIDLMKSFTTALGTRCEHCHVGEGNDLSQFDFASDAKPEKVTARKMMTMLVGLQRDYLKDVGDPARQPKVTCYTCHRGAAMPATAPAGGLSQPE